MWLIRALPDEQGYKSEIPRDVFGQKRLLNARPPMPARGGFLAVQDGLYL